LIYIWNTLTGPRSPSIISNSFPEGQIRYRHELIIRFPLATSSKNSDIARSKITIIEVVGNFTCSNLSLLDLIKVIEWRFQDLTEGCLQEAILWCSLHPFVLGEQPSTIDHRNSRFHPNQLHFPVGMKL